MGELLVRKAVSCRDRIDKLRAALPATAADVLRDERLEAFISFNLFLLVQDATDIGMQMIAARQRGSTRCRSSSRR